MSYVFYGFVLTDHGDFPRILWFGNYVLIMIIIIIISLFQEDNIFGTNASLTYGPRLQS